MNKKDTEHQLRLRLSSSLHEDIKKLAENHTRSVNSEIVEVLKNYVASEKRLQKGEK